MNRDNPDPADVLEALVKALVEALHPARIVLFGSRARGDARPDSDWDLLVIADTDLDRAEREFVAHRATWGVNVPKDILVFTPAEVARYASWRSCMPSIALREGRVVYEAT